MKIKMKKEGLTPGKCVRRFFLCIGIVFVSAIVFLYGAVLRINYGPSPAARNLFVMTVMETSAAKFLATSFFSTEEIQTFIAANSPQEFDSEMDLSKIEIPTEPSSETEQPTEQTEQDIEIVDIKTDDYSGKMMIVKDPSRVFVGASGSFGSEQKGLKLVDLCKKYGAVAGVNAGGFQDDAGGGKGGEPLGFVISQGQILAGNDGKAYDLIGFDKNNFLILKTMTADEAISLGIRDAVTFKPRLVLNGEGAKISGSGGGLNPRTAIGQRADGAVLLLVIDGRQVTSLGASYQDLVDVMLQFGAVNAANLDGGSSTLMVNNNEILNTCASLYGPRRIPDAFLVK